MRRATVGLWLAGLAAAGTALLGVRPPPATPHADTAAAAWSCNAGSGVGIASRKKLALIVNGISRIQSVLKKGDRVKTDEVGSARICLRLGRTTCDVGNDSTVRIRPKAGVLVKIERSRRRVHCDTSAGGQKTITTPQGNIVMKDPIFSVFVDAARTVVKVRRGAVVVARENRRRRGVVVPRGRQVVLRTGHDPDVPTAISTTPPERKVFNELERIAPPVRDGNPPEARIVGRPRDPSPSTTATFRFSSNESDSLFSCAVDDDTFHFCRKLHKVSDLEPGRHTLRVRAVDQAGNPGKVTSYSWTVERPASGPIAFESNRDGDYDIYLVDPNGTGLQQLTNDPEVDVDVSWSPSGKQLAFESSRDGALSEIYVMNADGTDPTRLTTNPANDRNPKWSPFGDQIAFESNRDGDYELYSMDADGGDVTRLTDNGFTDSDPAWSPDATGIAFQSDRDGNAEIYVMRADGGGPTRLTNNANGDVNPAWSPHGTKIAFESDRDGNHEIYVMNADGSAQTRLTTNAARDSDPVWSPDGSRVAFASDRDGDLEIYVMNADGSNQTRVTTSAGSDLVPSW